MANNNSSDIPAVRGIPPLYNLSGLIIAFLIDRFIFPLPLDLTWLGWILVVSSLILGFASFAQFKKAGENPDLGIPTNTLISSGPYAFSRNPLYITLGMVQAGLSLLFHSWWGLITLIPVVILQQAWVILPEEKYLEQKLGAAYIEYKQKVRRWI